MGMSCREVCNEISNYVDQDVTPALQAAIDAHLAECRNCSVVLQGMRNVVQLYRDERMLAVPAGFRTSLREKLAGRIEVERGTMWPLVLALAAALLLAVGVSGARVHDLNAVRYLSTMSPPARHLPPGMVAITAAGKNFHVRYCPFLHGEEELVPAEVAVERGYGPCVRCMHEALEGADVNATAEQQERVVASIVPGN
jgi:anti-sigma factor RsiW